MSVKITPINEEKLITIEGLAEPVSERSIRRKDGIFYIDYRHDKKNRQYLVSVKEMRRVAEKHDLDYNAERSKVYGRVTELIFLREVFDFLWPHRKKFPMIQIGKAKIPDLVRSCFHKSEHYLMDIYIPMLDMKIDCKNKWTCKSLYEKQITKINKDEFVHNARLNFADMTNLYDLQNHFPDYNLFYMGFNFSVPDKEMIDGSYQHNLRSELLETSIVPNSYVHRKDIHIEESELKEGNYKGLPKPFARDFEDFLGLIKNKIEVSIK